MNVIVVGTSGYSYNDWVGPFYPIGTKKDGMLTYYVQQFSLVELDFTYYQMPGLKTIQGLARKSPPGFLFAVKANRQMTHEWQKNSMDEVEKISMMFWQNLTPLYEEGKIGCLLLQFPYAFQRSPENLTFLEHFRHWFSEKIPLVIEFRHRSWVSQEVFSFLKEKTFNFCCVDEPDLPGLFPPLAVTTGNLSYLRFHGRNKAKWWNHKEVGERYDYLYSDEELNEWLPKIRTLEKHSETVMVLFNNCHFGQAARNALRMQQLLFDNI